LDLAGIIGCKGRIGFHNIGVGCIGHQDEFTFRIGLEDAIEEIATDRESGGYITEVERAGIKGSAGVSLVNEIHVVPCYLLWSSSQVVEMHVRKTFAPVGVDVGHVEPWGKWASEGVQKTLVWLVDLGDAQDVINVGDDSHSGWRNKV